MNFADVKSFVIPEGEVAAITCGGKILWRKQRYKRELAYLESTGTQWIDTGLVLNQNNKVEFEMSHFDTNIQRMVFGSRSSATKNNFSVVSGPVGGIMSIVTDFDNYTNNRLAYTISGDEFFKISISKEKLKINDLERTVSTYNEFTTPGTAYLFSGNGSYPTGYTPAIMRLYYCKIYDNSTLVRDFIPVIDMNDVACVYDNVSGKLFYNQGTGEFAYGELPSDDARLPVEYQEVEYIESTGTQYIDTGFVPNQDTRVITEHFYTKQPQNRGFIYGAGVSATDRTFELYTWGNNWNSPYGNTNIVMTPQISMFISGKINIDKNKNNVTITYSDGTSQTKSCEYVTFTAPRNLWLFAINRGSTSVDFRADCVQLCSCKILENDTLVRDFVPCYRKSDGKPGMYDLVTGEFFTNAGTGEFSYE